MAAVAFSLPNLLSLLRMALVPLFIIAITRGAALEALLIFALAGVTDACDGFITPTSPSDVSAARAAIPSTPCKPPCRTLTSTSPPSEPPPSTYTYPPTARTLS
jgi:hypothetical protein